jgi:microcystin degradation protein MlrC
MDHMTRTKKHILVAGLSHETHTFLPQLTAVDAFSIFKGKEMLDLRGNGSNIDGFLEVGEALGWEIMPAIHISANPGGVVPDSIVELFWDGIFSAFESDNQNCVDGVLLDFHGAMVSQTYPDVEGEILRRLRGLTDAYLVGVLDLHCNFTDAMAEFSDGLVAYRKNPHTDSRESAVRAARLLDRFLQTGAKPLTLRDQPAIVLPPTGTGTASDPMYSLEMLARTIENAFQDILIVNVFGGFSFADIPETGICFSAITVGDPAEAQQALKQLSKMADDLKESGFPALFSLDDALDKIQSSITTGPSLLVEPADNIGGGAPGDLTHILKALVERQVANAGVIINDPQSVQALSKHAPGTQITLDIGGKSGVIGAQPLPLHVELLRLSDGVFKLEDPHSHLAAIGDIICMGPCALVKHHGISILLTSRQTPPFDLAQWRSQGIQPEELSVIAVKAAVAHRQAYDPIGSASFTVDTPGPCPENPTRLPYRHIRRPLFPLDPL